MNIPPISDQAFERYSRQIMLPEWGEVAQHLVSNAKVLIIGCGGLGTAAGLYLAGAGVGYLVIADDDTVEYSNLARQVAYRESDIGIAKANALATQLKALNKNVQCRPVKRRLSERVLEIEVSLADIVLDCSDNMETRQAINKACINLCTPLVAGAAIGWNGQLMVFDFGFSTSPCYHCLFPMGSDALSRNCQSSGIIGPVVGIIGNLQALETLKFLTQKASPYTRFYQFEGKTLLLHALLVQSDPECDICSPKLREVPDEDLAK
ncbi:HesA/MoeB/ThiF family protein [Candidatus Enterovibrio escicola]|uniref:HesA/MoeB/ThiF family protein n=1 Tax=Candidatus Enterovibrio escicola TaxID=1927127 RepID=UPI001237E06F|nr:HesA/MoeB/ThiF family protein [Candidatus Enterovibrio escacola]